jgi:hypothetical protein
VVAHLDEEGRWLENGRLRQDAADAPARLVIDSATFIRNVAALCDYLAAGAGGRGGPESRD